MSRIDFCKRGGQQGIRTTISELTKLSDALKSNILDEYIPLPGMTPSKQAKFIRLKENEGFVFNHNNVKYWEANDGSHGWCCFVTGKVIQWG